MNCVDEHGNVQTRDQRAAVSSATRAEATQVHGETSKQTVVLSSAIHPSKSLDRAFSARVARTRPLINRLIARRARARTSFVGQTDVQSSQTRPGSSLFASLSRCTASLDVRCSPLICQHNTTRHDTTRHDTTQQTHVLSQPSRTSAVCRVALGDFSVRGRAVFGLDLVAQCFDVFADDVEQHVDVSL
jgi:hypothetical protein